VHRDSSRPPTISGIGRPPLLAWAAVLLLAAVGLGAAAFTRPAGPQDGFRQDVDLSYSAPADAAVYDGGRVRTGDPVYLRLVKRVEVQVGYHLVADGVGRSSGTIALDARLSGSDGWQRTTRVAAPMRFAGRGVGIVAQVDVAELASMLRKARARTGAGGTFWLDLVPRVSVDAVVGGKSHALSTAPEIGFRVGDDVLVPDAGRAGARGAPIRVSTQARPDAATVVPGTGISVGQARVASLGLALGAMLLAGLGTLLRPGRRGRVTDRRGRPPIEVDDVEVLEPAVDVGSMDDLLDLAERYDRPLMHVETRVGHTYLVEDRGVRYRFGRTALLPMPEPRFVPDPLSAADAAQAPAAPEPAAPATAAAAATAAEQVPTPAAESAPAEPAPAEPAPAEPARAERESEPETTSEPEPESESESASALEPAPRPQAMPLFDSFDEAFAAEFGPAAHIVATHQDLSAADPEAEAHVQRSVPEIELAPERAEHPERAHAPRHRRSVDLTAPERAERAERADRPAVARTQAAAWRERAGQGGRPDPVEAALRAAVTAVPPPRRPPADAETRYGVEQPGMAQLRSWLRT
jgi:hypothetical protein